MRRLTARKCLISFVSLAALLVGFAAVVHASLIPTIYSEVTIELRNSSGYEQLVEITTSDGQSKRIVMYPSMQTDFYFKFPAWLFSETKYSLRLYAYRDGFKDRLTCSNEFTLVNIVMFFTLENREWAYDPRNSNIEGRPCNVIEMNSQKLTATVVLN